MNVSIHDLLMNKATHLPLMMFSWNNSLTMLAMFDTFTCYHDNVTYGTHWCCHGYLVHKTVNTLLQGLPSNALVWLTAEQDIGLK